MSSRIARALLLLVLTGACAAGPEEQRVARVALSFDAAGSNPAIVLAPEPHLVSIDAATQRLVHRRLDLPGVTPISPEGDRIDLRGENPPLFAQRSDGALLVVYPIKGAHPGHGHHGTTELRAQLSRDGGRTWSAPVRVDGDVEPRSHNFADLAITRGGEALVSWLDSRAGQQGVQTTVVRADLSIAPAQTADAKSCQCCRTALFTASTGEVWLAYRDLAAGNVRNMAYSIRRSDGVFASKGDVANDRWSVNGCPESGPRFAETADGTIWLAWFNGAADAIELAAAPRGVAFTKRPSIATKGVNHPDLGTLADGRLIAVYEAFRNGKRAIEMRTSDVQHARWSAPRELASEGFSPRFVRRGDQALLAYSTFVDSKPHVRVIEVRP